MRAAGENEGMDERAAPLVEGEDYTFEDGLMVMTEAYHRKRGSCCGSGCRHCPYREAATGSSESSNAEDAAG